MVVGLALAAAGCGGSSAPSGSVATGQSAGTASTTVTTPAPTSTPTLHVAQAAAATPSKSAQMICDAEAQQKMLSDATGVRTTEPVSATWTDSVYSCRYVYGTDVMVLSVKELADKAGTDDYYSSLGRTLGVARTVSPLGEAAFVTRNGSLVVRKDFKVLLVDVGLLPEQFGSPANARENIALNAASAIMGCWEGD
jgi:hypothetical protein